MITDRTPRLVAGLALAGVLAATTAAAQTESPAEAGDAGAAVAQADGLSAGGGDLFEVAEEKGLSTLVEALQASNATWFLDEGMPYTLLAPTDDAFDKLPDGVLDALLTEENRPKLNAILEGHVIPDETLASSDLSEGKTIDPATGEPVAIAMEGDEVRLGEATVTEADIETRNGIVHVIDTVLVPDMVVEALKYRGEWPEDAEAGDSDG